MPAASPRPGHLSGLGLSGEEAARRLRQDGYNELPRRRKRTALDTSMSVVREPMFLLLLAAGAIYMLLGDAADAILLLAFVVVSMAITIIQERKADHVLESLKDMTSPRALVIRDGEPVRIAGREVVAGDALILEEGDRIAADGYLAESHDLLVDESLLTGESVPVVKEASAAKESGTQVRSGTLVVRGGGLAIVSAIGANTEIGRIGLSLQEVTPGRSPLQEEIKELIKRFAIFGVAISTLTFALHAALRGDWLGGLLAGVALAMSTLPEEFTVIFTVFMALGAWRIAKSHVLTRHTPVIEALGRASVLCVDKTGTLTQNRMTLQAVVADGDIHWLDGPHARKMTDRVREILRHAALASEILPFDPMEKAMHAALRAHDPDASEELEKASLVHDYPLAVDLLAMTHAWRLPGVQGYVIATKGAPEAVGRLCRLDAGRLANMLRDAERLAMQGMRVIAVGKALHLSNDWPADPRAFRFEWLGLVGLADPLRPEVRNAVAECRGAGIRVVMVTGDYPATALAVAREAGLPAERAVTGEQLRKADEAALGEMARSVHVFARVLPDQKLRLVSAFRAAGHIVAMTGDGVNDAPALKAAHIGISMGGRGTDVAREASSLVLLDDDFASIVRAIRLGRQIYDNLRKALIYVVAVHVPIAGMVLLPVALGAPHAFAPVHIVFLEMIINPACALVFEQEPAHRDLMKRPPRPASEPIFGGRNVTLAVLLGAGMLAAVALIFHISLAFGLRDSQARALGFAAVVIGNLALIVSSRSMHSGFATLLGVPNSAQWRILAGGVLALAAVLGIPALQSSFHFSTVAPGYLSAVALAGIVMIGWFEFVKRFFSGRERESDNR